MTAKQKRFKIEINGLTTPCRFVYSPKPKEILEIARFEKGLQGPAEFPDPLYQVIFKSQGILIPIKDTQSSLPLQDKASKNVFFSDPTFGEAFYRYYARKISKHEPDFYRWEII
jgi:hypothetical protein